MISRIQWVALLLFYLLYLLVGSAVFLVLEASNERENIKENQQKLRALQLSSADLIHDIQDNQTRSEWMALLDNIGSYCDATFIKQEDLLHLQSLFKLKYGIEENRRTIVEEIGIGKDNLKLNTSSENDKAERNVIWTMWNSFFFTFACITTIGYGNMSPSTESGQIFSIFYSLIGVPLNCIVFSGLSDLFNSKLVKKQAKPGRYNNKLLLLVDVFWYLMPGLIILMMLPAGVFCYMEEWTYTESFYFAFISLTTIGFGDYVAGRADLDYGATVDGIYKGGIFIWIVFGLGYLLMVVGVIQKGLRSPEIRKVDRKMAKLFKEKAGNINVNMRKDLERIRRILDTINILQLRQTVSNNTYAVSNEEEKQHATSSGVINEAFNVSVRKATSETEISTKKESNEKHNQVNNVNIFMDLAETILHRQETEGLNSDTANGFLSTETGPTSIQSDPPPSGHYTPDNLNLQLIGTKIDSKNKSDSHLHARIGSKGRKSSKVDNKYLEQCKSSFSSYTNQAYEGDDSIVEEISNKDVEVGPVSVEPQQSHKGTFNDKLIRFKNYILNKTESSESDEDSDSNSIQTHGHTFTLSHLLGEIETLLLREIGDLQSANSLNQLKRTLSVPPERRNNLSSINEKILSNRNTVDLSSIKTKDINSMKQCVENVRFRRRWTLASITLSSSDPVKADHRPSIVHSMSEPAPSSTCAVVT